MTPTRTDRPRNAKTFPVILGLTLPVAGLATFALVGVRIVRWTVMTLTMFVMSAAMSAEAQSGMTSSRGKLEPAIVKASDDYVKAVLASDAHAVAALYRDDAVEMPNGAPAIVGRAAIERHYTTLFNGPRVTAFAFTHLESFIEGDLGYDAGTYERVIQVPGGETIKDVGKYVVILKRTQGQWKAAYVIYNGNAS